jgi:hypothetical protein
LRGNLSAFSGLLTGEAAGASLSSPCSEDLFEHQHASMSDRKTANAGLTERLSGATATRIRAR